MPVRVAVAGPVFRVENADQVLTQRDLVIKQLRAMRRSLWPVVRYFGRYLASDISGAFKTGGYGRWLKLRPNTVAAHGGKSVIFFGPRASFAPHGLNEKGTHVNAIEDDADPPRWYALDVNAPFPGPYQHFGTRGPYTIAAKSGKWLRFPIDPNAPHTSKGHIPGNRAFTVTRAQAAKKGMALPPKGAVWLFAKFVRHPGLPARPIVRMTRAVLDSGWYAPLRRYLHGEPLIAGTKGQS